MHRTTIVVDGVAATILGVLGHAERSLYINELIRCRPRPTQTYVHDDEPTRVQVNLTADARQALQKVPNETASGAIRNYICAAWNDGMQAVARISAAVGIGATMDLWNVIATYRPTSREAIMAAIQLAYVEPTMRLRSGSAEKLTQHPTTHTDGVILHQCAPVASVLSLMISTHQGTKA